MNKYLGLIAIAGAFVALPAFALDLASARSAGSVGETQSGYVAAIGGGGDVASLVSEVNAKRRAEYSKISAANGQPVDVVAKLAAPKIIQGLPSGAKYQDASGSWKQK